MKQSFDEAIIRLGHHQTKSPSDKVIIRRSHHQTKHLSDGFSPCVCNRYLSVNTSSYTVSFITNYPKHAHDWINHYDQIYTSHYTNFYHKHKFLKQSIISSVPTDFHILIHSIQTIPITKTNKTYSLIKQIQDSY